MKLSELQAKERTVPLEFDGEPVNVTYRAHVVTPAFLSENPNTVEQIKRAVIRWDILDDEGNALAPDEVVDKLPVQFLSAVLNALTDDMRIGAAEKKG